MRLIKLIAVLLTIICVTTNALTNCDYPAKPQNPRDISTLGGSRSFCESLCFLKLTGKCSAGGYVRAGCLGYYLLRGNVYKRCAEQSQSKNCHIEIKSKGGTSGTCPSDVDLTPDGELCRNAKKWQGMPTVDDSSLKIAQQDYLGQDHCAQGGGAWRGSHTIFENTCGDWYTMKYYDRETRSINIEKQGQSCSALQLGICPTDDKNVCCKNAWNFCMGEKKSATQFWATPAKCPQNKNDPGSWSEEEAWWATNCQQSCQMCPEGSYTPNIPGCPPGPAPAGHTGNGRCVDLWLWKRDTNKCIESGEAPKKCPGQIEGYPGYGNSRPKDPKDWSQEDNWWHTNCKAACGFCPKPCNVKAPPGSPGRYSDSMRLKLGLGPGPTEPPRTIAATPPPSTTVTPPPHTTTPPPRTTVATPPYHTTATTSPSPHTAAATTTTTTTKAKASGTTTGADSNMDRTPPTPTDPNAAPTKQAQPPAQVDAGHRNTTTSLAVGA